jgi:hypothetical protein
MKALFFTLDIKQLFDITEREQAESRRMISREKLEDLEKAEQQIDQFISKRSKAKEKVNAEEEAWKESTRRVNDKRRRANRLEWIAHHGKMNRLHLAWLTSTPTNGRG